MRKYVIDFVDHFQNKYHREIFTSFEDPLSENEWDETAILTKELKDRGVLLVGDDLFVTQIGRLSKGVEQGAGTAILIKPNQNGTIIGTIDTMEFGLKNSMEEIASHRSGETLDSALADLAVGFRTYAIKTGAPQPESEYPNPEEWERRNKYLRKIEIQEQEAQLQKAIIIGPEFFTAGGTVNALKQMLALNRQISIVLYGPSSESIKALMADKSIITAETLTDAVTMLKSFDYPAKNIVLLGSVAADEADTVKDIKQIPVTNGIESLVEALNSLLADKETQAAFAEFNKAMSDFKVNEVVSADVEQAIREEEEFFNKV
jgi:uracil phosphoribosyltransferase